MRFHVVRTALFVAATTVPLVTATAQEPTKPSQQDSRPGPWAISLGLNSTELNLGTQRPGIRAELMGAIARHWNLVPRLELRTQAVFGLRNGSLHIHNRDFHLRFGGSHGRSQRECNGRCNPEKGESRFH